MHLRIAEKMCASTALSQEVRRLLAGAWPAFYLGNVAPDFQVTAGLPRASTHFYEIPPDLSQPPYEVMWQQYPELAEASNLPLNQAVFVAGYAAHLLLDIVWLRDILYPYFFETQLWNGHNEGRVVHFILLTYLDRMAADSLPPDAGETLSAARNEQWLPFGKDAELSNWRDMLADQLQPGREIETIPIYAERVGLTADEFGRRLEDPEWMETHLLQKIPVDEVQRIIDGSVADSVALITEYLTR